MAIGRLSNGGLETDNGGRETAIERNKVYTAVFVFFGPLKNADLSCWKIQVF